MRGSTSKSTRGRPPISDLLQSGRPSPLCRRRGFNSRKAQNGLPPMNRPTPAAPTPAAPGQTAAVAPEQDELPPRELSPAARRALADAAMRRAEIDAKAAELTAQAEKAGRGGLEPV